MRISVAGLERQAVAPVMFEGDSKSVIEAGSDVALVVHGAEGISVGIELIQRTHAIGLSSVERYGDGAKIHRSAGEQTNTVTAEVRGGYQEVRGKLMLDSRAPFHGIKITTIFALQLARVIGGLAGGEAGEIRDLLFIGRQDDAGTTHLNAEGVAFQAGVEIIILSRAVV